MERVVMGTVETGKVYRRHESRMVERDGYRRVEDTEFGEVVVEDFVWDGVTRREMVLCRGLDGSDTDRRFVFTMATFAGRFRLNGHKDAPEKVLDIREKGGGW